MSVNISEADIEKMIFENSESIYNRGFEKFLKNTYQQFKLPSGKRIDILSDEDDIQNQVSRFKIFELKKDSIGIATLTQALIYLKELLDMLNEGERTKGIEDIEYEIVLCGSDIDTDLLNVLEAGCNIRAYTYGFNYNGLFFNKVHDCIPKRIKYKTLTP